MTELTERGEDRIYVDLTVRREQVSIRLERHSDRLDVLCGEF